LKFVSSSAVRTKIIISLTEGTTRLKDMKEDMGVDSSTILHAMKKLENKNLIYKKGDEYFISQTGVVIGLKLIDMIKLLFIFKENDEIMFDQDVPLDIVTEFKQLHFADFEMPENEDFNFAEHFKDYIVGSDYIRAVTPICNSNIIESTKMIVDKNKEMDVVLNPLVYEQSRQFMGLELFNQMNELISREKIRIWSIEQDLNVSFFLTDKFVVLGFIKSDGEAFKLRDMISYHPNAINWGNRLFDYYQERSERFKL